MPTYANIDPTVTSVGIAYATAKVLTGTEVSIYNAGTGDPIPMGQADAICAIGSVTVTGGPASNSTYVVLQTDMGDDNWVDVAWFLSIVTSGTVGFVLATAPAALGATQTRATGTAPSSSSQQGVVPGMRCRFVGKAALSGGTNPAVAVTLKYRKLLRPS